MDETWVHYFTPETKKTVGAMDSKRRTGPKEGKNRSISRKGHGLRFLGLPWDNLQKGETINGDLWGPLLLCTLMATFLQGSAERADDSNDGGPEFAEVFVLVWIGAAVVTINSKLLGGNISFFQSVCVLGYCLFPVALALVICRIILFSTQNTFLFFLRFVISMIGFMWATFAATKFLGDSQPEGKKALAVYPICLFYFILSWLVVSHSNV